MTTVSLNVFHSNFCFLKVHSWFSSAAHNPQLPQRPRIIAGPQNISVSLHQNAILECMATGNPRPIISWSRADSKSIDVYNTKVLGNGNLIIMDIKPRHGGVYVCRATTPGTRNYTVASANITVLGKTGFFHFLPHILGYIYSSLLLLPYSTSLFGRVAREPDPSTCRHRSVRVPGRRRSDTSNHLAKEWRESSLKRSHQDVQRVCA